MSNAHTMPRPVPKDRNLSPERILEIARAKGQLGFNVSLRYRDDNLRRKCYRLLRDGLLTGGRRKGDQIEFYFNKSKELTK